MLTYRYHLISDTFDRIGNYTTIIYLALTSSDLIGCSVSEDIMHKLIILCVVTSLTSVLASQSVTVEERAISLFENLSSQCRENIKLLKDAQCKWTINVNDMTVYEDRRTNCVNNMRQRHEMCMRRIARCEQAEVDTFLQRLCDFDQYTKVK